MGPRFSKTTIDTLAQRARYLCSNPDCRVPTAGASSDATKATIIGEAAHIYGAKPGSARYRENMSDAARGQITNGIWLCRNCHKKIDTDNVSADNLFRWRSVHDHYTHNSIGSNVEQLLQAETDTRIKPFLEYSLLVQRIVADQPPGWEWQLTAELMREINSPIFQRLDDLQEGLYSKPVIRIEDDELLSWLGQRLQEIENVTSPIKKLMERLTSSWGPAGEAGDLDQILHIVLLIGEYLEEIVRIEESVRFVNATENGEELISLLQNLAGGQARKLNAIPGILDDVLSHAIELEHMPDAEPQVVKHTITYDVPKDFNKKYSKALKRFDRRTNNEPGEEISTGVWIFILIMLFIWWVS